MELLVIAIVLTLAAAHGYVIKGPVNTVSVVGSNVTLKCASTSPNCSNFDWVKSDPDASPSTIYKGFRAVILSGYTQRYSIDNSTGCHLVIKGVRTSDAGRYTCTVSILQSSAKADAYLIVLESEPQCSINASQNTTVEGDGVKLTCAITYNGKENVSLVWKDVEDAPPVVKRGNNITLSHSFNASAPVIPSYTCIIAFPVFLIVIDTATNVPTTNCTTPVVKLLFPVRNAYLRPSQKNYSPGANITCLAEGRPAPSFRWQILEMENGSNGTWKDMPNETRSHLVVHNVTENLHRCVAVNVVRTNTHSVVSPSFQVNDAGTISASDDRLGFHTIIGIGIGIGVGIGFIFAILLASIAFAMLVKHKYLELHPNPAVDGVARHQDHEMSHSSRKHSAVDRSNTRTGTTLVGEQESTYAGLGEDRDVNEYASLEQKQKAKSGKKSRP